MPANEIGKYWESKRQIRKDPLGHSLLRLKRLRDPDEGGLLKQMKFGGLKGFRKFSNKKKGKNAK